MELTQSHDGSPGAGIEHGESRLSRLLGSLVEVAAAVLIAAEVVILFAGVFARYALHNPVPWIDELASILFLWLAMLGAAIALRRREHMRMTAALSRFGADKRALLDGVAMAAPVVFLALILPAAMEYLHEEYVILTPALEVSNASRVAAIPAGLALMLIFAALQLLRTSRAWISLAVIGGVLALLCAASPLLMPLGNLNLVLFFVVVLSGCIFAGIPIAFAFALATFGYLVCTTSVPLSIIPGRMEEGMSHLILSSTGAQTETVPPSIVLITIGSVTGVSIASLFTGGLVPALVLGSMLCLLVFWRARQDDLSHVRRASGKEIARAFAIAAPAIALPFVIRAAVVEGVATATEVSTIGIAYCALAGLIFYGKFEWKKLHQLLVETASLSGAILLIIGTATAMAWALTQSGFSHQLAEGMSKVPGGAAGFIIISIIAFIVLGSVLEGIPAIVLFGPMLFPIAKSLGIHPVHYSMIVVLAMGIGLFAPPFGVGYYAACAIGKVHPDKGMREILPYIGALFAGLAVVAAFPVLSTGFLK